MEQKMVKIFGNIVPVPTENSHDRFVISPLGLRMVVTYAHIKIGKIPVLVIRVTVNDAVSASVDFIIDFLTDKEGACDRILLINLFSQKVTGQILEGLK